MAEKILTALAAAVAMLWLASCGGRVTVDGNPESHLQGTGPSCTTKAGYYPGGLRGRRDKQGLCVPDPGYAPPVTYSPPPGSSNSAAPLPDSGAGCWSCLAAGAPPGSPPLPLPGNKEYIDGTYVGPQVADGNWFVSGEQLTVSLPNVAQTPTTAQLEHLCLKAVLGERAPRQDILSYWLGCIQGNEG